MCGIVGFLINKRQGNATLAAVIQEMTATLVHRGPDFGDTWVDAQMGLALGHRRLSILDLSPGGNQPMTSACERYVIVFNGEIYNFRYIKKKIETETGFNQWRGHSDTEVMLAAISSWGVEESLKIFNGMFAFALWDRKERILSLARDRFGEKPLYYGNTPDGFLFSSELKAFKKFPDWKGTVSRDALVLFLRYGYIPSPYSIYQDVFKLPPASFLKVPWGHSKSRTEINPKVECYWSIKDVALEGVKHPTEDSEEDILAQLDQLLTDAVKIRLESDVPLGAFLSGGVDSSLIVALMQKLRSQPVKTFSIGFHEEKFNEAHHAKQVAKHLNTDHSELYLTPEDTLKIIPQIPSIYDEPFADPSQIPTFLVSKFARQQVTVSLSGDAGDELFGGYDRYIVGQSLNEKLKWVPDFLKGISSNVVKAIPVKTWEGIFSPFKSFLPNIFSTGLVGDKIHKAAEVVAGTGSDYLYKSLISHWRETKDLVIGGVEPQLEGMNGLFKDERLKFRDQMMLCDLMMYLPEDILVKVDRASMAVSLESRVPLLDPTVAEFAWKIPASMKFSGKNGKMILRKLLYKYVPRQLIERPKQGFAVPIGEWLRGPLRDWAEELLNFEKLQKEGFLNAKKIQDLWREHLVGERNFQYQLWNVLMFEAWLKENEK